MSAINAYVTRARALGWPLLATGLALLLAIVALAQPVWVYERRNAGGDVDKWTYSWTVVVQEEWMDGVWAGTAIVPYSSPAYDEFRMREAVQTSFLLGVLYVVALVVLAGLYWASRTRKFNPALLTITSLAAFVLGIASTVYALAAIPGAAAADVNPSVGGFFGQAPGPGTSVYTWGAGATWWLWLAATVLSLLVFAVPFVQRRPWARPVPTH